MSSRGEVIRVASHWLAGASATGLVRTCSGTVLGRLLAPRVSSRKRDQGFAVCRDTAHDVFAARFGHGFDAPLSCAVFEYGFIEIGVSLRDASPYGTAERLRD